MFVFLIDNIFSVSWKLFNIFWIFIISCRISKFVGLYLIHLNKTFRFFWFLSFQIWRYRGNLKPLRINCGDGLANVDIGALRTFHTAKGTLATVTTVQPTSRFGVMDIDGNGIVQMFREKPTVDGWVNIGFFIFDPKFIAYLDAECTLEEEPLARLARESQLSAFKHSGFWQPMDTYRESKLLNDMWQSGEAPWKVWTWWTPGENRSR